MSVPPLEIGADRITLAPILRGVFIAVSAIVWDNVCARNGVRAVWRDYRTDRFSCGWFGRFTAPLSHLHLSHTGQSHLKRFFMGDILAGRQGWAAERSIVPTL